MTDVIAVTALVISIAALIITYWQTKLVRQSIESQTFLTVLERAREIDISSALDLIGRLQYTDYTSFEKGVPPQQQAQIRAVADFFNDLSHMMRSAYVDDFYPMRIYYPALLTCSNRLFPWWFDGIRANRYPLLYDSFRWLCQYASFLEGEKAKRQSLEIPRIGYRKFVQPRLRPR